MKGVKMDKEKMLSFYEKMYFKEIDEMNTILSRYPVLLAGVALIFNAYMFLFKMDDFAKLNIIFVVLISIIIAFSVIMMLRYLLLTFKTQPYQQIKNMGILEGYRKSVVNDEKLFSRWNEDYPDDPVKEIKSDDALWDHIVKDMVEITDINFERNQTRRKWFHKSVYWIWINLCLCITIPILLIVITSGYNYVRTETIQQQAIPTEATTNTSADNKRGSAE